MRVAISKQLAETAWPDPAPGLGWQPGGVRMFARSIASAAMSRIGDSDGFRKLVYPANVKVALAHVADRRVWSPEFGQTIAFQIERAAIAALTERIGPKYRELVASRVALPKAEELVGTRTIDPMVARPGSSMSRTSRPYLQWRNERDGETGYGLLGRKTLASAIGAELAGGPFTTPNYGMLESETYRTLPELLGAYLRAAEAQDLK